VERDWRVIGEYVFDGEGGRHQAFYAPLRDTVVMGDLIRPYDRIQVEQSLKYSPAEAQRLWKLAGMTETNHWRHVDEYGEYPFLMPDLVLGCVSHPDPVPSSRLSIPRLPHALPYTWDQSYEALLL
jgi:hypothetical protein